MEARLALELAELEFCEIKFGLIMVELLTELTEELFEKLLWVFFLSPKKLLGFKDLGAIDSAAAAEIVNKRVRQMARTKSGF